jgi:hypothetical protein
VSSSSSESDRPKLWCDRNLRRGTTETFLPDYDAANPAQDLTKGGMVLFRVPTDEEDPAEIDDFFKRGPGDDPAFADAATPALRAVQNAGARDALQACIKAKDQGLCLQGTAAARNRRCVLFPVANCVAGDFTVFATDDKAACCALADVACN